MAIETINPFDNKVVKTFDEFSDETVKSKIAKADEA